MTVYLTTTKPNSEFKAVEEMKVKGLDAFTPREMKLVKPRQKKTRASAARSKRKMPADERAMRAYPFLKRYVAVEADTETVLWAAIENSRYGVKPLTLGGPVARLKPSEVEHIKAMDGRTDEPVRQSHIQPGDAARIIEGPFIGFPTVVDGVKGDEAYVTVQMFGRANPIRLPVTSLERAA